MTFLELCQFVARESGVVSGTNPTTVTGQSGSLADIVVWVNEAWRQIQNRHHNWRWMRGEFEGSLTAGTARYTGASFSLSRWARWIEEADTLTLYLTATGVSDEGGLTWLDWHKYRRMFERGTQTADRPVFASVSPAGELCFGSKPDATYTVRGEYQKKAQVLSVDADEPELPSQFHEMIAWYAVMLLHGYDEAAQSELRAVREFTRDMNALRAAQLPTIHVSAGPLA